MIKATVWYSEDSVEFWGEFEFEVLPRMGEAISFPAANWDMNLGVELVRHNMSGGSIDIYCSKWNQFLLTDLEHHSDAFPEVITDEEIKMLKSIGFTSIYDVRRGNGLL